MTLTIHPVRTPGEISTVARLAREIWTDHYVPIVGAAQIDYMLGRFQSEAAITAQLREGFTYLLVSRNETPVGYAAVQPQPGGILFLSKLYVHKTARGTGAGKALLDRITTLARDRGLRLIRLTVNRHNRTAIDWYHRQGFITAGTQCPDIGGGYVMDDYVLETAVPAEIVYIITVPEDLYTSSPDYPEDRDVLAALAGVPCRMIHYRELTDRPPGPSSPRILSGGKAAPHFPFEDIYTDAPFRDLLRSPAPTLALCRSFQLASALLGAPVRPMPRRPGLIHKNNAWYEEGPTGVRLLREDPLFEGLPPVITVHQNHKNEITALPPGRIPLAESAACPLQAWKDPERLFYALQFHPERGGHPHGHTLLRNFFRLAAAAV